MKTIPDLQYYIMVKSPKGGKQQMIDLGLSFNTFCSEGYFCVNKRFHSTETLQEELTNFEKDLKDKGVVQVGTPVRYRGIDHKAQILIKKPEKEIDFENFNINIVEVEQNKDYCWLKGVFHYYYAHKDTQRLKEILEKNNIEMVTKFISVVEE